MPSSDLTMTLFLLFSFSESQLLLDGSTHIKSSAPPLPVGFDILHSQGRRRGVSFHMIKINIFSSLMATTSVHGAPYISFDPEARSHMFRRSCIAWHALLPSHFRQNNAVVI
jgi:hypothetical protein